MISMRVLSDQFAVEQVTMASAIRLVEAAFAAVARGGGQSFPVVVEFIPEYDAMYGIKSGYLLPRSASGPTESSPKAQAQGLGQQVVL